MFDKLLIADRGEIAVRIMHACAEMGIQTVAIFTEVDRYSLHVKRADEAYHIGEEPLAGYANSQRVVDLARKVGCSAIHPGYGPLSKCIDFVRRCDEAGITFIGPDVSIIDGMADKTAARRIMREAGIPIVPGSPGSLRDQDEALCLASTLGYPVMLKAVRASGGRAICRCDSPAQLSAAWLSLITEARQACGSAEFYIEKYIAGAQHIEVQLLADHHGNAIHLFERDGSIQHRYRKLIDIAPGPCLTPEQRAYAGELSICAARMIGYQNAGAVEFLVRGNELYFLKMTTRIQVEHTVTEMITGVDIIREQIRIAAGEKLAFRQEDIRYQGYAIQLRINAEDPKRDFLPSFGRIAHYYAPGGPGVRIDTAIYTGYSLPSNLDSLCLKLIVWGLSWEEALARGIRALNDVNLQGVKTTADYYQRILCHDKFRDAQHDIGFTSSHPELLDYPDGADVNESVSAIAALPMSE